MKARRFNSYMPYVHEIWAGRVLQIPVNNGTGPDLIDNYKVAEVKFALGNPREGKPNSWTVQEHQMAYGSLGKPAFWALGLCWQSQPVSSVRTTSLERLEELAERREMWLISWDWMNQFPPSKSSGKTRISEWDNDLRYPKIALVPETVSSYRVDKGIIHFTRNVPEDLFKVKGRRLRARQLVK